ncbi:hypothetical protein [Achromobacter sp. DH1f]|uniref:hypothetical protein n=1 Tax=Achromobacter sp. DH1f TaxID=1397275 RepID=UPI00046808C2|nr:hypothetical protein [Achromobacter sp. DH1f]
MNTAQLSVLPDDLAAVSLTPLRRAVQRVRTFGTRFSELAMPWTAAPEARGRAMDLTLGAGGVASAGTAAADTGKGSRSGTLPGKWPFPPAAAEVTAPAAGNVVRGPRERSLGNATVEPVSDQVSVKSMVVDVVLVLAWGAMIPALMWLGAAGGF